MYKMQPSDGFLSFISTAIPTAVALMITLNLSSVITSIQTNLINPSLGLIPGVGSNIASLEYIARNETEQEPAIVLHYGQVISSLISFVIVAFIVYLIVLFISKTTNVDATKKL